jgi:gamma-glutamyltranspeptidase/glutathione hydrolase
MYRKILVFLLICLPLQADHPMPLHGTKGVVVSRSTLASEAGVEMLRRGGNAVDAAIATGFALAVTYPSAGNLGGGGFMVIRLADGQVFALDFRETAPGQASRDMFLDEKGEPVPGLSRKSHLSSGVPGSVDGLLRALDRFGTLPLGEVLAPAIRLAYDGFSLPPDLAQQFAGLRAAMAEYPASTAQFFKPDGSDYQAGDVFRQGDLAETLRRIAREGRKGFYEGPTAKAIVSEMIKGNGLISLADLAGYQSKWREPLRGQYRSLEVWSMPPPSSGGVLLINMLNMLEPYDLKALGFGSAATIHLMVEAERRAYADRAMYLGDPDFVEVPTAALTEKTYARRRFADFLPNQAGRSEQVSHGSLQESHETTHYSVVDAAGNAVACTTTLNFAFGSRIVVTGAGFLLNNEMDDFSAKPFSPNAYGLLGERANEIQPGKRMLSSMTPTVVTKDGKLFLVLGSPGGSTIITTVLQVLINCVDFEMNMAQAVAMPRFHHQWQPDRIVFEPFALNPDTRTILLAMGHRQIESAPWPLGDANCIMALGPDIFGACDPRSLSQPVGF